MSLLEGWSRILTDLRLTAGCKEAPAAFRDEEGGQALIRHDFEAVNYCRILINNAGRA